MRDENGYHYEILCDFVGIVQYKWSSIGVGEEAVQAGSFRVEAPPF